MSVRKITIILLMIVTSPNFANRPAPPGWHWSTFSLQNNTSFENENLDSSFITAALENCFENLTIDNDNCNYAGRFLILLTRIDIVSIKSYSNRFLERIPDDWKNELYYLRKYAINALARIGEPEKLIDGLNGEDPTDDQIYLMAMAGDYRWDEEIINDLLIDDSMTFCESTLFVKPFLSESYVKRQQFLDLLKASLLKEESYMASCSIYILFNMSLDANTVNFIKSNIISLFNSGNRESISTAALLTDKWPISVIDNTGLISKIISIAIASTNNRTGNVLTQLLLRMDIISHRFPKADPQNDRSVLSFSTPGTLELFNNFIWEHKFDVMWLNYADELEFTDIQDLLIISDSELSRVIDLERKLQYFNEKNIIHSNRLLKSLFLDLTINANSSIANLLKEELYSSSDALQKIALIARYPIQFSTKPIIKLNSSDPWIQLAELTNLLTICGVEVPPIGSELSNPAKLTKYLEDGNELLEGCTRLGGR